MDIASSVDSNELSIDQGLHYCPASTDFTAVHGQNKLYSKIGAEEN